MASPRGSLGDRPRLRLGGARAPPLRLPNPSRNRTGVDWTRRCRSYALQKAAPAVEVIDSLARLFDAGEVLVREPGRTIVPGWDVVVAHGVQVIVVALRQLSIYPGHLSSPCSSSYRQAWYWASSAWASW